MNRAIYLCAWLLAMLTPSLAAASSATANAGVVVENYPLQLQKYQDLYFGTIAPSGSISGSVVITPAGQISSTGGTTIINSATATAAAYFAYGVPNSPISIVLPTETTLSGPSGSMVVRDFVSSAGGTSRIEQQGYTIFSVGATLAVPAGQLPGTYNGTFAVTVAYN